MGYLIYDSQPPVEFEDRLLAHLQMVIGAKLRRNEAFFLSWTNPANTGSGRYSIWIHPAIPVCFQFRGNRPPAINREWVDALMDTANSASGLRALPETGSGSTVTGEIHIPDALRGANR